MAGRLGLPGINVQVQHQQQKQQTVGGGLWGLRYSGCICHFALSSQ